MIKVTRDKDGKVFASDMSKDECIIEIHFCTSYTQVKVYEFGEDRAFWEKDIICQPIGTKPNTLDLIATQDDDTGTIST